VRVDPNYENRRGFDANFVPDLTLQIWDLVPASMRPAVAPLVSNGGDSKNELRYQHFTVIVNADRRLAILTATMIDGQTYIKIDRQTGEAKAEAVERWFDDPRMLNKYYVGEQFYAANRPILIAAILPAARTSIGEVMNAPCAPTRIPSTSATARLSRNSSMRAGNIGRALSSTTWNMAPPSTSPG
jgi:hypothetical protein